MANDVEGGVWVGVLTFTVETPGVTSLKAKRGLVKPLVERMRSRFPVSVARLSGLDRHDEETIGGVTMSSDPRVCEAVLGRALAFAEGSGLRIRDGTVEVERWD